LVHQYAVGNTSGGNKIVCVLHKIIADVWMLFPVVISVGSRKKSKKIRWALSNENGM
jgi:hypothetical protein